MELVLKKNIVNKILAHIPDYMNPVDFLQEALDLSKESVYRRLKGDIAFTLDDVIKLSSKLSFSLDEIISSTEEGHNGRPVPFHFRSTKEFNPQKTFTEILSFYIAGKERVAKAKDVEVLVASNRLMLLTGVYFKQIFKFYYYKWVHQTQQMPLNFSFSDVVIPDDIIELREKLIVSPPVGSHVYVLDSNFLRNTLNEVQYYYKRKLISEEEIALLKKDFSDFVDVTEYMIMKQPPRVDNHSTKIYISATQIETTGMYCRTDDRQTLDLWLSFGSNIHTENVAVCKTYVSWVNTLKKFSSLITGCDEASQMQFIDRQRSYIENLASMDYGRGL